MATVLTRRGRLAIFFTVLLVVASVAVVLWGGKSKKDPAAKSPASTGPTQPVSTSSALATSRGTTPSGPQKVTLTPAPSVAAAEKNQAIADGCEMGQTTPGFAPECRYYPNKGKGDVVLVGDSHAAQWLPAIKTVAKSHGWGLRVWARANCPFADVTKLFNGVPGTACNAWRANVMQRLLAAHPTLVVVASYPPPGGQPIVDPSTGIAATSTAARPVYVAGMVRELKRLTSAGIHTLLIKDVARYNVTAAACATAHPKNLSACSAPEATAEQSAPDTAAAAADRAVHTLDLTSVFCHSGRCYQIVGSIIAYRDTNHFSHEMASALAPRLDAAMTSAQR